MPTILDWLGLEPPAQCDGASLLPYVEGRTPAGWRQEAHWEYDFRDIESQDPERALGIDSDACGITILRDNRYKYVHFGGLPSLFFDLEKDPGQFKNLAADPQYTPLVLGYAQKMLTWRMQHAEHALARMFISDDGVIELRRPAR
jgi:arylsulfatase A-like enzyme